MALFKLSKLVSKALSKGAARAATYTVKRCPMGVASRTPTRIGHRCDRRNTRGAVARRAVQEGRAS